MFKATIQADTLKDMVEAISIMADEIMFKVTPDVFSCRTVDQSNVAMAVISLNSKAFLTYEATETQLGISLNGFKTKLEIADKTDIIELDLDETKHALNLKIGAFSYSIQLLDPAGIRKEPKVPNLNHDATVVIKGDLIKKPIKAIQKMSEFIKIGIVNNIFIMESDGQQDTGKLELPQDKLIDLICNSPKAISLYSIEYIANIERILSKLPEITMKLHTDFPLLISGKFANGNGGIEYLIAPRVTNED